MCFVSTWAIASFSPEVAGFFLEARVWGPAEAIFGAQRGPVLGLRESTFGIQRVQFGDSESLVLGLRESTFGIQRVHFWNSESPGLFTFYVINQFQRVQFSNSESSVWRIQRVQFGQFRESSFEFRKSSSLGETVRFSQIFAERGAECTHALASDLRRRTSIGNPANIWQESSKHLAKLGVKNKNEKTPGFEQNQENIRQHLEQVWHNLARSSEHVPKTLRFRRKIGQPVAVCTPSSKLCCTQGGVHRQRQSQTQERTLRKWGTIKHDFVKLQRGQI